MRNIIYIFLVFVLVFFLNLLLYIYVDAYRNFIKVLKYGNDPVSYEKSVDDSYNVNSIEEGKTRSAAERGLLLDLGIEDDDRQEAITITSQRESATNSTSTLAPTQTTTESQIVEREIPQSTPIQSGELVLSVVGQEIVAAFQEAGFEILEKEDKDDLLDIAREYPDDYIQYGNNNFDLYILPTRLYDEVDDIFTVLEFEMPYTLNKTDNFGERSFFINLDRPDEKVRFIFQYKGEVYGVKVRTPNYNAVKSIINTL